MSISAYNAIGALEEFLFGKDEPSGADLANTYRGRTVEPQHAYCWEFKVENLGSNFEQDMRLYAQEVSIPPMEQEPVVKEYRGKKISYQGKNSSPLELDVKFYDTQDLAMYKAMYKWFRGMNEAKTNKSVEPMGGFFNNRDFDLSNAPEPRDLSSNYFFSESDEKKINAMNGAIDRSTVDGYYKSCYVTLLDTHEKTPTGTYTFSFVFPISIGEVSLDYSANEIMTFNVKFSYFDVEAQF